MSNKHCYSLKESAITYILAIATFFCAGIFLSSLIQTIATLNSVDPNIVSGQNWVIYLNLFLSEFVYFIIYVGVNASRHKDFLVASKIKNKFDYKIFLLVVLIAVFCVFSSINMTNLVNYCFSFVSSASLSNAVNLPLNNFWLFLFAVFLVAVLPAVCEELVFRGIIYNGLRQKFNAKIAIILSAVMFTLVHFLIYKTFYQFILGIILGCMVYLTGSIVYGIIFHFTNNFLIIILNYVSPHQNFLQFTTWGAKEILLTILFFVLGIGVIILFFKVLSNYTKKHKNYFGIEDTNKPLLEKVSCDYGIGEDASKLSEYDKKILNNSQKIDDKGWLIIGIMISLFVWALNSFGVF